MAIHVIIGGVVFVAALVSLVVLVIMVAAAARSPGRKGGSETLGHGLLVPSRELSSEPRGVESAQGYWDCYRDCMNGFHWAEDWGKQCSSACGMTEERGAA